MQVLIPTPTHIVAQLKKGYKQHPGKLERIQRRGRTWILALWLGIPEDKEINTVMWDKGSIRSGCK